MDNNKDFDEILKSFKGYDSNGNLIVGDEQTGEFQSLDKNDFSKIYDYAKTKVDQNKKFEDTYKDFQAKEITKDKDYLGQDNQGNSVFKNQQGVIERAKFDFAEGLKRQFGDKTFDKTQQGVSNQVQNENKFRMPTPERQAQSASANKANLAEPNMTNSFQAPKQNSFAFQQQRFNQFQKPTRNVSSLNSTNQNNNTPKLPSNQPAIQQSNPPSITDRATQAMGQGLKNQVGTEVNQQTKKQYKTVKVGKFSIPIPVDDNGNVPQGLQINGQGSTLGKIVNTGVPLAANVLSGGIYGQVAPYVKQTVNGDVGGIIKNLTKDPVNTLTKAAVSNYLPQEVQDMYGQGQDVLSTAQTIQNALKDPKSAAINYAKDYATNMVKDYAKNAIGDVALNAVPGGVGTALNAGKILLGGGNAAQKGSAAAQAAARIALASATGGLSEVVNPETLGAAASGLDNIKNSKTLNRMGVAGDVAKGTLGIAKGSMQSIADVGNEAMQNIGSLGSDFFSTGNNALKGTKDAVKNLTQGNIAEGLKGLGSTALKTLGNTLIKTPVNALKKVAGSVGRVVKNLFCFAPGTEILMKDGSYKKVEEIKIGEEVALGGRVTAIGQAEGTNFVVIKGVHVIETHALYENGKWVRANKSKNIEDSYFKEDGIVYPIITERHLVVTKGQVWADAYEHDDKADMTEKESIEALNEDKKMNDILKNYVRIKGW